MINWYLGILLNSTKDVFCPLEMFLALPKELHFISIMSYG